MHTSRSKGSQSSCQLQPWNLTLKAFNWSAPCRHCTRMAVFLIKSKSCNCASTYQHYVRMKQKYEKASENAKPVHYVFLVTNQNLLVWSQLGSWGTGHSYGGAWYDRCILEGGALMTRRLAATLGWTEWSGPWTSSIC